MTPARKAAFLVLLRVKRESSFAVELLHSPLLEGLSPVDRNLAQEIVLGVLRWQSLLDESFAALLQKPLSRLDPEVVIALRMASYQLAFLDRIPAHAIVNETVELIKKSGKRSASGLVNAVTRKLAALRNTLPMKERGLAHDFAHPQWLVERWVAQFGHDKTHAICAYDQQVPATALRITAPEQEDELRSAGVHLAPGTLMKNARIVTSGDVTRTRLFSSGQIAIQDEGSQLVAALVGAGQRILDCCAAPGGKTAAIAMAQPHSRIFATDIHAHRARVLRKIASQPNVHVFAADARQLPFVADFDRILADVPCSGTGTLARNPEIKWRLKPEDLADLQARQIAILTSALQHVAPGGRIVYSSCSLEAEENKDVIEKALKNCSEFQIVPMREELAKLKNSGALVWPDVETLLSGNFLRTLPGVHPCDGFFAAVIERTTKDTKGYYESTSG
ncbi:MAG TPA: 16S rRNA (cytosine(967)-C(5))-methyltransferase RsmB [Candidatus Angelobacter sp.]